MQRHLVNHGVFNILVQYLTTAFLIPDKKIFYKNFLINIIISYFQNVEECYLYRTINQIIPPQIFNKDPS